MTNDWKALRNMGLVLLGLVVAATVPQTGHGQTGRNIAAGLVVLIVLVAGLFVLDFHQDYIDMKE